MIPARSSLSIRCELGLRPRSRSVGGARLCPQDQPQQVRARRGVELFRRDVPFACAATGALPTVALRWLAYSRGFRLNDRHEPNTRAPPAWPAAYSGRARIG